MAKKEIMPSNKMQLKFWMEIHVAQPKWLKDKLTELSLHWIE